VPTVIENESANEIENVPDLLVFVEAKSKSKF
jgi:hypothetical protein